MDWIISVVIGVVLLLVVGVGYWAVIDSRKFKHIASLKGKHVVITGGSSGIGLCIAQQCAAEGAYLTLIARTQSKLQDVKRELITSLNIPSDAILIKPADVGNAEVIAEVVRESFKWRPIDVLVCSAGIMEPDFFEDIKPSRLEEIGRTNILGCIFPIQAAIPLLKTRSREHPTSIVIIGSMSACVCLYGSNMYTPSKCALKGFAELLKFELLPFKIGVTLSLPAFTQTPLLEEVVEAADGFLELAEKIYLGCVRESPVDVARLTIEGFKRGDFLLSTTLLGFVIRVIGRGFVPPDSFCTLLVEMLLIVPMRFATFVWARHAKHVLLTHPVPAKKKA